MRANLHNGFTLIELIVVIIILGIISVTAAPRFVDIYSHAKKANHAALTAAVKSAANFVRMKCIVDRACNITGDSSTNIRGVEIMTTNGWPVANPLLGMGNLIVDHGDWVINDARSLRMLVTFIYPNTGGHRESDCKVTYYFVGFREPVYNGDRVSDDTCS